MIAPPNSVLNTCCGVAPSPWRDDLRVVRDRESRMCSPIASPKGKPWTHHAHHTDRSGQSPTLQLPCNFISNHNLHV